MGGCLSSTSKSAHPANSSDQSNIKGIFTLGPSSGTMPAGDGGNPVLAKGDFARTLQDGAAMMSSATSSVDNARRSLEAAEDRIAPAPSSSDSRLTGDALAGMVSSPKLQMHGPNPNPLLTESTLEKLNQAPGSRRGLPSSTGGTTANTRPTDLPELNDLQDGSDVDHLAAGVTADRTAPVATPLDAALCTPPPPHDGLPVVSLHDIVVMEQRRGRRGRHIKSRRGSTTASHASLSAIPENVEITPLHARSERSDSVRVASHPPHSMSKLADVLELDAESKSNTVLVSRPSNLDSSPSSSSLLTAGDDSVMPPHIEAEYELHMPILPQPRAYWRRPNATEYAKAHAQPGIARHSGGHLFSEASFAHSAFEDRSAAVSSALADAVSSSLAGEGGGGPAGSPAEERVLTDDAGLQLVSSVVEYDAEDDAEPCELFEDDLKLVPPDAAKDGGEGIHEVTQGTVQQETVCFRLPAPVEGLRCVKKYAVGELSWNQTVLMGDFDAGEHVFQFEESQVPTGTLTLGDYRMKTVFMDTHGRYLWAGAGTFRVVRPPRASAGH